MEGGGCFFGGGIYKLFPNQNNKQNNPAILGNVWDETCKKMHEFKVIWSATHYQEHLNNKS